MYTNEAVIISNATVLQSTRLFVSTAKHMSLVAAAVASTSTHLRRMLMLPGALVIVLLLSLLLDVHDVHGANCG